MSDDCCRAFADSYEISSLPAMQAIERTVLGCDYGGTSWTTAEQVQLTVRKLRLGKGDHVLDIGAGSGWPGLFLATQSGCGVTLLDIPQNALRKALARANCDHIGDRVVAVAASGDALPFAETSFDAISHSDVLCCLPEKIQMLNECRRVAVEGGKMLFTVIRIADGLQKADYERVVERGPPFIEAPASYGEMLETTGWQCNECIDVTPAHRDSLTVLVDGLRNSHELADAIGADAVHEEANKRQRQIGLIDEGLMIRESYLVTT
jgi:SAM-dependent methyltransferase